MRDKEQKIIEQRTIEASKKGLMGFSGKMGTILRYLGQPMLTHYEGVWNSSREELGYSSSTLDEYLGYDIYDNEPEATMETMEAYDDFGHPVESPNSPEWGTAAKRKAYTVDKIGYYFQSLSSGINLEIKYLDNNKELITHYQGYLVYKEMGGELQAYVPNEEWEKHVDSFYRLAKKKEDEARKKEKVDKVLKAEKNKAKWLETMKTFWGV